MDDCEQLVYQLFPENPPEKKDLVENLERSVSSPGQVKIPSA